MGKFYSVIDDLPVWFVGYDINAVACLFLLLCEKLRKPLNRLPGINGSGRIVRRIDQHSLRVYIDGRLKPFKINLECLSLSRNHGELTSGSLGIYLIFREIRRKGDNLILRPVHQTFKTNAHSRRSANRHENIIRAVSRVKPFVQ